MAFNLTLYEQAHVDGFDEVLLLNEEGFVSECTSANVFAVFGDEVATPPLSSGCLPGITREILLTEIRHAAYRVTERALTLHDLEAAEEVFVTSTTRDLLSVESVSGIPVRHGTAASELLGEAFRAYRSGYVASHSDMIRREKT